MLDEAVTLFFNGEPDTAKLILRDLVNATVGFESLAQDIHKPAKSLHRMLSPTQWRAATKAGIEELPEAAAGACEWQLWSYCPALLAGTGVVDPLSLTLSLQDNPDERIQLALDELKAQLPW